MVFCSLKGIDLLLEVLWIEVGGFERSVFVWTILRVRHSPPSSIIMYSWFLETSETPLEPCLVL